MEKQPNKGIYHVVVVIWLTLSLGSVVLAGITWSQLSRLLVTGRQTGAIRDNLDQILKSLLEGENGSSSYVITGDKNFVQALSQSATNLPVFFDALAQIAKGDSDLSGQVDILRAQAGADLSWQFKLVSARDRSFGRAAELVNGGDGQAILAGIRRQIGEMINVQLTKRAQVRQAVSAQLFRAGMTSLGAGILGLGAGIYALWLSRRSLEHQSREQALMEAKLRAEHSNEEKNVFLANMSHEIRTPMNAILGFTELLLDEARAPRQRQYLQSIRSSANSLLMLINDILDVSKIEAGVMSLHPEPTDPREISDLIRTLFAEPAAKKGVRLECNVTPDVPRAVLIDRIRLRQILVNLVGNAVKFTDVGVVETRVTWNRQPDSSQITLVIEVQDTGVGIPADKIVTIFQPFTQSGAHREKENQGTGLGLAIVQRLTELMGGAVTVASVLGQGSVFHLRFPDVAISARLASSEKNKPIVEVDFNDLSAATLLVVDDNHLNCELIGGIFTATHHRLVFAATGEEALVKIREDKPDIVLLDMRLPGISGEEVLARIRRTRGLDLLPVIAVTASALLDAENALKERFSGYVRKPFTKRELFDELAEFLPGQLRDEKAPAPTFTPVSPPVYQPAATELVAQLRQLVIQPWPSLRDSVAVNESRVFARDLESLGRRWQSPVLASYAQRLLQDVENYDVAELETHLSQFASLVEHMADKPTDE